MLTLINRETTMSKHALKLAAKESFIPATATTITSTHDALIQSAAQIVSAYIINRPQEKLNLTQLTADVYGALAQLSQQKGGTAGRAPTVAIEDSITPEYLICLEDGKQVKMLKRYLRSNYNMTPEEYRARWNLPATYPMVAPNYAKVRSNLAKKIGLGKRRVSHNAKRLKVSRPGLR